jgi:hypothetical protein
MSAHGRSEALIPGARSAEGGPMSAHGRSEALIPERAAARWALQ